MRVPLVMGKCSGSFMIITWWPADLFTSTVIYVQACERQTSQHNLFFRAC